MKADDDPFCTKWKEVAEEETGVTLECEDFFIENIDYVRPWEETSSIALNKHFRQDTKYSVKDLDTQLYIIENYNSEPTDYVDGYWRFYLKSADHTIISYIKFGTDCSVAVDSFAAGAGIPQAEFTYAATSYPTGNLDLGLLY